MRYSVVKRPAAENDIEECFVHIAKDDPKIGLAFLAAVEDGLKELAEFPLLGKAIDFRNKKLRAVRMWHVKGYENYLIFYTVRDDTIEVIRVLNRSRDIEELFG